jgi:hypothetical protein
MRSTNGDFARKEASSMNGFLQRMSDFADAIAGGKVPLPTVGAMPEEQCLPGDGVGVEIAPNQSYFTVTVNELNLAAGRKFWTTFDPMVLAIVEFVYDRRPFSIPVVIGPSAIKQAAGYQLPLGLIINDAAVVGPHPYRGGNVTVTMLLYRVRHSDYARGLLQVAENISKAIGVPADVGMLEKVGSALLDGVETLLKLQDTVPLAGHMFTVDGGNRRGFRTGYSMLIASNDVPISTLRVKQGRLQSRNGSGWVPYRESDFVLYSVMERSRRGEVETLPFIGLLEQGVQAALADGDDSWKRAKSALLSLYGQMVTSNDLIPSEVEVLCDEFTKTILAARNRAAKIGALSSQDQRGEASVHTTLTKRLNSRIGLLELK